MLNTGTIPQMLAFIKENFGENYYSDDNCIVDSRDESGKTYATIANISRNEVRITYADPTIPSKIVPSPTTYPT